MCFTTKNPVRLIASKDIICYKVGHLTSKNLFRSYYKAFVYKFEEKYSLHHSIEARFDVLFDHWKIFEGFHSYKKIKIVKNSIKVSPLLDYNFLEEENLVVIKCIIPKGTVYYENNTNEFVSEEIIPLKIVFY